MTSISFPLVRVRPQLQPLSARPPVRLRPLHAFRSERYLRTLAGTERVLISARYHPPRSSSSPSVPPRATRKHCATTPGAGGAKSPSSLGGHLPQPPAPRVHGDSERRAHTPPLQAQGPRTTRVPAPLLVLATYKLNNTEVHPCVNEHTRRQKHRVAVALLHSDPVEDESVAAGVALTTARTMSFSGASAAGHLRADASHTFMHV